MKRIRQQNKKSQKRQIFPGTSNNFSDNQYMYRLAIKDNARQITQYYMSLVNRELQRYLKSTQQMRDIILGYFRDPTRSGDYNYQVVDYNIPGRKIFADQQKLNPSAYEWVANAIVSSIGRELDNANYGYALFPSYPYYYSDNSGAYLFPSSDISKLLYSKGVRDRMRSVFYKYFSQVPNFGAIYDVAIHQYPVVYNRYVLPQNSPAYPIYLASQYSYQLPQDFIGQMLTYINASDDWNKFQNEHDPDNGLIKYYQQSPLSKKLSRSSALPAGYYTPQQILYLARPLLYSYFQPDIPIYQSFTNYYNLHRDKWPNEDVRKVLTHFMSMYEGFDPGKPLLGVRTQKEDDHYHKRTEFVDGDIFEYIDQSQGNFLAKPVDYVVDPDYTDSRSFSSQYKGGISSGIYGKFYNEIPQIKQQNNRDYRRLPSDDNL